MNQMNRKILFRGKRADNGDWVEGNYLEVDTLRGCMPLIMGKNYDEEEKCITDHALVIPSTVGQYTGVKDKFNEKVFEGDYVYDEEDEKIGIVEFDEGEFVVCFGDVIDCDRFADVIASCHVIGNIHDNPELLKGE